jgi:heme-degrading monooxygenase HmoA
MFIAMNRFRVKRGTEDVFEKVWPSRDRACGSGRVGLLRASSDPAAWLLRMEGN